MQRIDDYLIVLRGAPLENNFATWPIDDVDFSFIYAPYTLYEVGSHSEEITHLKDWIKKRLIWIDDNIEYIN